MGGSGGAGDGESFHAKFAKLKGKLRNAANAP
jgi:hypothetical protein